MLVLSRQKDERILIGDNITIMVVDIRDGEVIRLGIEAPRDVAIHRQEVHDAIHRQQSELRGQGAIDAQIKVVDHLRSQRDAATDKFHDARQKLTQMQRDFCKIYIGPDQ